MRRFYQALPLVKPVTQGSIINHCIADNYQGKDVYGMIITPRCDLDHQGKVNTVHYLPIVDFTDWINVDGEDYFYNKWSQKIAKKFKDKCHKLSFPDNLQKQELYVKMADKKISDKSKRDSFKKMVANYFNINRNSTDFVGGLEFNAVYIIGVDQGRVPPNVNGCSSAYTFTSYAWHNRMYVAVSRAKYYVALLGNSLKGKSSVLETAIENKIVDFSDNLKS